MSAASRKKLPPWGGTDGLGGSALVRGASSCTATDSSFSTLPEAEGKNRLRGINQGLRHNSWGGWVHFLSVIKLHKQLLL